MNNGYEIVYQKNDAKRFKPTVFQGKFEESN